MREGEMMSAGAVGHLQLLTEGAATGADIAVARGKSLMRPRGPIVAERVDGVIAVGVAADRAGVRGVALSLAGRGDGDGGEGVNVRVAVGLGRRDADAIGGDESVASTQIDGARSRRNGGEDQQTAIIADAQACGTLDGGARSVIIE